MTGFDDRKRGEETRFKHDQELTFKARNRGNKIFGLWVAERLGLSGEEASAYAKDIVMADFELPGDEDIFTKVRADLAAKSIDISERILEKQLQECRETAAQQIKGALDELGRDVPALAIAVEPPRDTADSARAFLSEQRMLGRMSFVLGERSELAPIWRGYAIRPQSMRSEHQARIVLVDGRGFQRVGFPIDQATPERIAHDLRMLEAGSAG